MKKRERRRRKRSLFLSASTRIHTYQNRRNRTEQNRTVYTDICEMRERKREERKNKEEKE